MSEQLVQSVQARGNVGFSLARILGPSRSPLGIAAFIAIPLFFSSLMASALALEKPLVHQWKGAGGKILTTWHEPTTATETRVWLWAMVPPLVLTVIGLVATRLPFGFYIPCVAAIVVAMAVVHKTATWERHHVQRYPWGVDLIPGTPLYAPSDKFDRGQWEQTARETALSLQHWTIGLALASALVVALLYVRRRYFSRTPVPAYGAQLEGIHATDATSPGLGENH